MSFSPTYPRDIAELLLREMHDTSFWKTLTEQEAEGNDHAPANRTTLELPSPMPTVATLAEILDLAFAVSLLEEEGRRCAPTIAFVSPEGATRLRLRCFEFEAPLAPLSPKAIAKVAPAADPARTFLAVWPADNGQLRAWGLLHRGDLRFAIDLEHEPTFLTVRVLRPATFTVRFGEQLVGVYVRDHWNAISNDRHDLLSILRDRAGIEGGIAREFRNLATRMLSHGHGGTILIVDKDVAPAGLVFHPVLRSRHANSLLADARALDERFASGSAPREVDEPERVYLRRRGEAERAHDDALDFVANLTCVDGALVIRDNLQVVGFGATIKTTSEDEDLSVLLEDPRTDAKEKEVPASTLGGNRHRSAVLFCRQQKTLAVALVASQDGDLSLIAKRKDGKVHVIRPFELGVGM